MIQSTAVVRKGEEAPAANGRVNRILPEDSAVHSWYRFVLSFPPHLVATYLDDFGITPNHCVLDPFCGTGTTLVECKKRGIPSVGAEAHPMAWFASKVKTDWAIDPDALLRHSQKISDHAARILDEAGLSENVQLMIAEDSTAYGLSRPLRSLPPEQSKLLLENSISPMPLHRALVLLQALAQAREVRYADHERLAFAKALVEDIGNLHFGPEVGIGTVKKDARVIEPWLNNVARMASDLRSFGCRSKVLTQVHLADARRLAVLLHPRSVDAVITSPPYPNEKDYTRTTRLESVLLGFIRNREELRALKKTLIRSNTRGVYKEDDDDALVSEHREIQRIADEIERRRVAMGKTSGFERLYARVTRLYFGGMVRHLTELKTVLRPGARLAYVVGDQASYLRVMIRTGQLLADIAQSLGYELVRIDLFRTRLATATREQLREEVVILRWPGRTRLTEKR